MNPIQVSTARSWPASGTFKQGIFALIPQQLREFWKQQRQWLQGAHIMMTKGLADADPWMDAVR